MEINDQVKRLHASILSIHINIHKPYLKKMEDYPIYDKIVGR